MICFGAYHQSHKNKVMAQDWMSWIYSSTFLYLKYTKESRKLANLFFFKKNCSGYKTLTLPTLSFVVTLCSTWLSLEQGLSQRLPLVCHMEFSTVVICCLEPLYTAQCSAYIFFFHPKLAWRLTCIWGCSGFPIPNKCLSG